MNAEITPAHIDGLINAWVRIDAMATTYGPGLLLAAAIVAAVWASRRIAGAVHDRIGARRGIRRLENYINNPGVRAATRNQRKEKP